MSVPAMPPIPLGFTAMLFNDMINANVRGATELSAALEKTDFVSRCVSWVGELRKREVPIFWVRVERRADRKMGGRHPKRGREG